MKSKHCNRLQFIEGYEGGKLLHFENLCRPCYISLKNVSYSDCIKSPSRIAIGGPLLNITCFL